MWTSTTIADLRRRRGELSGRVALVPTMGALHAGHLSLIEAGRRLAHHVLVSIFVNPAQFGPHEDFNRYPRPLENDLTQCAAAGAAGVFCPSVEEMYPAGGLESSVEVPALATILEGAVRPGHFRGVCRVVAKLFHIVEPEIACFGQKDYQQLKIIEAMAADLNWPLRIVGLPTMREPDGLAMSSRNMYLNSEQRKRAAALSKALREAKALIEDHGETDPEVVEEAMRTVLRTHQIEVDYAVVRHPQTLLPLDALTPALTGGVVALVAGRLDNVRLIDNEVIGKGV